MDKINDENQVDSGMSTGSGFSRDVSKGGASLRDESSGPLASIAAVTRALLTPLASLHLTVVLLVLSIFVTWVATLQQTRKDIWTVKSEHFPHVITKVDFETFFPPAWFPSLNGIGESDGQLEGKDGEKAARKIPGHFYIPSGFSLIVALLVNLTAAHLLRMRIQATGAQLIAGLIVMGIGGWATWFVINSGQNPNGFQDSRDPAFYRNLWSGIQVLVLLLAVLNGVFAYRLPIGNNAMKLLGWIGAVVLFVGALAMLLAQDKAFIGDSAMRIMWQLIQASIVAAVALAGCFMVFRRKGGVVLVHAGITLLLGNEIWVTLTHVEQQMHLFEGESASFTVDMRSTELYLADKRDKENVDIVQVPGEALRQASNRFGRLGDKRDDPEIVKSTGIEDDRIPFRIVCEQYFDNADLASLERAPEGSLPAAMNGYGKTTAVIPLKAVSEMDDKKSRNYRAAIVRLFERDSGRDRGTWLVSELADVNQISDTIEIDGVPWQIGMRWTHYYKPYTVTLNDVSSQSYEGTTIPMSFASLVSIDMPERGFVDARRRVWMNNPMRFGDETFYQSGYDRLPDGREYTVLQIVHNKGWMIPYVACMYVVIGLIGHFGTRLGSFISDTAKKQKSRSPVDGEAVVPAIRDGGTAKIGTSHVWRDRALFWSVISFAGILAAYGAGLAFRKPSARFDDQQISLDAFGRIPVSMNGRIQPMESVARDTARMLNGYDSVSRPVTEKGDLKPTMGKTAEYERVSALQWLADVVFAAPGYEDYLLFRIVDLDVLGELGLEPRKGLRYSLAELEPKRERIEAVLRIANQIGEGRLTNTQKRMVDLNEKMNRVYGLRGTLGEPDQFPGYYLQQIDMLNMMIRATERERLPLAVPAGNGDWVTLSAALAMEQIRQAGRKAGSDRFEDAADAIAREVLVVETMVDVVLDDPQMGKALMDSSGTINKDRLRRFMLSNFDSFPAQYASEIRALAEKRVEGLDDAAMAAKRQEVRESLRSIYGNRETTLDPDWRDNYASLIGLGKAWRDQDKEAFESITESHLAAVSPDAIGSRGQWKTSSEILLNRLAPFFLATFFYGLAGLVVVASWIAAPIPMQRAASWILWLAVATHVFGIVLRVIITGRPPVTNLYSSFLFVSLASAVMLQLINSRIGFGIGTLLGSVLAIAALLWAHSISVADGDTMVVLLAVLDTQFWLSTHVICISLGYSATIAAGAVGIAWMIMSLLIKVPKDLHKVVIGVIYGVTAFALLLSFFGTVLGGLWGDDSWGRFWGWDPKENGALMIVLWNALPLHARMAGMIRDRGVAALSIFGIVITIWSWECVNQLGVGLHSYGVSSSRLAIVLCVMGVLSAVSLMGLIPRKWWRNAAVH